MLLHDVIYDVILLPVICGVSGSDFVPAGQCTSTLQLSTFATVELLHQETPKFLVYKLWPPNSPDLSPVDYEIWAVMSHRVYRRQIHSVDELKRWLINVWCGLEQSIFDETIDQWRGRNQACVHAKGRHLDCELTMLILSISVTFRVTCLTVASLITKSRQQRWPIHSCSLYKVVHLQIRGIWW